jgi:hypothetical protein
MDQKEVTLAQNPILRSISKNYEDPGDQDLSHHYIPESTTWEAEIGRITVGGQPKQKLVTSYLNKTSQVWQHVPVIPVMWEVKIGGSLSKTSSRQKAQDTIFKKKKRKKERKKKKTKARRVGGMAQVTEYLPSQVQGPEFKSQNHTTTQSTNTGIQMLMELV